MESSYLVLFSSPSKSRYVAFVASRVIVSPVSDVSTATRGTLSGFCTDRVKASASVVAEQGVIDTSKK